MARRPCRRFPYPLFRGRVLLSIDPRLVPQLLSVQAFPALVSPAAFVTRVQGHVRRPRSKVATLVSPGSASLRGCLHH